MTEHPLYLLYRDVKVAGKSFDNFCNIIVCLNQMMEEIPDSHRDDILDHIIEFLKTQQSPTKM
jgi:hypothetical protein